MSSPRAGSLRLLSTDTKLHTAMRSRSFNTASVTESWKGRQFRTP